MTSFEQKSLHYEVIANTLEKAARVAKTISDYYIADLYPSEKAEAAKKRLRNLVLEVLDIK